MDISFRGDPIALWIMARSLEARYPIEGSDLTLFFDVVGGSLDRGSYFFVLHMRSMCGGKGGKARKTPWARFRTY